jgi:hypothetical protein
MTTKKISLTASQAEFVALTTTNNLFCAGMGSGKTHTMSLKAVMDMMLGPDVLTVVYEPDYPLIKEVAVPAVIGWLNFFGLEEGTDFVYNKNDHKITTLVPEYGNMLFKSLNDPDKLIAYQSYSSHIDELDTLPDDKAALCYQKIIGRNRQQPNIHASHKVENKTTGKLECVNRINVYTTPEGYQFCYKKWGVHKTKQKPNHSMVQGKTRENPTVTDAWIEEMTQGLTDQQVKAYLNGEFVNMTAGTVYYAYDRTIHTSREKIIPGETLYIGMDFNVYHMSATVYVRRDGGRQWHAVEEISDVRDTADIITLIEDRYLQSARKVIIYPDASGDAQKTSAATSDIAQLKDAGFTVRHPRKNGRVKDRVAATNKGFENGLIFVNEVACPQVASCFEQQAYNKKGEPDKTSGNDHQNDASTYPIVYELPIRKKAFTLDITFAL